MRFDVAMRSFIHTSQPRENIWYDGVSTCQCSLHTLPFSFSICDHLTIFRGYRERETLMDTVKALYSMMEQPVLWSEGMAMNKKAWVMLKNREEQFRKETPMRFCEWNKQFPKQLCYEKREYAAIRACRL